MFGYESLALALDEVAWTLIRTNADHLVMGARQPDEGLRTALAEAGSPFIVALDDPRNAVADLLAETNAELRTVTRPVANSCPLVIRYLSIPGALAVRRDESTSAVDMTRAIGRHFGMEIDLAEASDIVAGLAAVGRVYG